MYRAVRDWGHFVTKVDPFYKPKVFQSNRQLQKFLSAGRPIHNRSFKTLNDVEIEALALGLGFIPTVQSGKCRDLTKETNRLIKAVNTTVHFALQPQQQQCSDELHVVICGEEEKDRLRYGSLAKIVPNPWEPPRQEWLFEPQIHHLVGRLAGGCGIPKKFAETTNTAPEILEAFDNLLNDPDILVCAADKGGTIVIWRAAEYEREALSQLSDRSTYDPVSTETFHAIREDRLLIERKRLARRLLQLNCLNSHEYGAVVDAPAEPALFYMKPKLHKAINRETATFHGRPIASTCKSAPRLLDKYLANVTSPLLPLIPGSLTDTTHLLQLLSNSRGEPKLTRQGTRLVTVDVNSLYPSIPWEQGVAAAVQFYTEHYAWLRSEMRDSRGLLPPPPPDLFAEILWFIVSNSFVSFKRAKFRISNKQRLPNGDEESLIFHQTKGTAMGCCVSVYLANCFMYRVTKHVLVRPPGHLDLFLRYIDDILISTRGTDADLSNLISSVTTEAITYTVGDKIGNRVEFLDVAIEIDSETNRIETRPFQKATACPFYLHAASMHPKHTIESLPYAQLIRLKRICSAEPAFRDAAAKLLTKFESRGYKTNVLKRALFRASALPRNQLLLRKNRSKNDINEPATAGKRNFNTDTLKFIPTFDKCHDWRKTRKTFDKLKRLTADYYSGTRAADELTAKKTALIFKRARNVGASFLNKMKKNVCLSPT
jgi:hypothetical protein